MIYRMMGVACLGLAICAMNASSQGQEKGAKAGGAKAGATSKLSKLEIVENDKGKFYYKIVNGEGKTVHMSPVFMRYETKAECLKALEDLKTFLEKAKAIDVKAKPGDDTPKKKKAA